MNIFTHYGDVIMGAIASHITSLAIVYPTVYSDADQRKHESSASLAFVRGIHRGPVNSPHKWSVTRKMFPFDDVIMCSLNLQSILVHHKYPHPTPTDTPPHIHQRPIPNPHPQPLPVDSFIIIDHDMSCQDDSIWYHRWQRFCIFSLYLQPPITFLPQIWSHV